MHRKFPSLFQCWLVQSILALDRLYAVPTRTSVGLCLIAIQHTILAVEAETAAKSTATLVNLIVDV